MKEESQYEIDKQKKKEKLVRCEFLYNGQSTGQFDFPIIKKQDIDVEKIKFLSFVNTKKEDSENKDKTIHFFTYDWLFEKVYENAEEQLEKLSQYYALLSPDFSLFTNMPLALQIESVFKNRWCGAYWQSMGLKVIPTLSWGDEKSFDFCFDGIEEGSVVAVCTYYREVDAESFMLGYNEMLKRIKPSVVICYDEPFKAMKGNIIEVLPTTYEWTKSLSPLEQARFKWEKRNRWISGLNKSDFKYFDYEDPYSKEFIKKCDVCGKVCLIDQFGNGTCENCGWDQGGSDLDHQNVGYPNTLPLSKAKILYKQKQPLLPDFEDFVNNLAFYGEMEIYYRNEKYIILRYTDHFEIEFYSENDYENIQKFKSYEDFKNNCQIDNRLLKDIWNEIKNVDFLN